MTCHSKIKTASHLHVPLHCETSSHFTCIFLSFTFYLHVTSLHSICILSYCILPACHLTAFCFASSLTAFYLYTSSLHFTCVLPHQHFTCTFLSLAFYLHISSLHSTFHISSAQFPSCKHQYFLIIEDFHAAVRHEKRRNIVRSEG